MDDQGGKAQSLAEPRRMALPSSDNEGSEGVRASDDVAPSELTQWSVPALKNTELMQLRVRVIALENVVISLLAQSSDPQLDRVRRAAAYIAPRPGFSPHPLTIRAGAGMVHLVARARHFRGLDDSPGAPDCLESRPVR